MSLSRRTFLVGVPTLVTATALATVPAGTAAATPRSSPHQSPVALSSRRARRAPWLPELVVDYPREVDLRIRYVSRDLAGDPTGCASRGREETVEAEVPAGAAALHLGGVRYELLQFHFHTPSEHVLDGHRFPLEQHLVHRGPDGQTLVLGLFLSGAGRGGTLQDRVLAQLPEECGAEEELAGADLASALPRDLSTFRYDGSLTTNPYTEGVSWLVLRRHRTVSTRTLTQFRTLFPAGDARDLQPLGDRVVAYREQR